MERSPPPVPGASNTRAGDDGATGAAGAPGGETASAAGPNGATNDSGSSSNAGPTNNTETTVTSSGGTSANTSGNDSSAGGNSGSGGDGASGDASGSGGSGLTSSGASATAGTGGSGESTSTASGGSGGSTSDDPELGAPCDSPGELACNGATQKLQLICEDGTWERGDTCDFDENCDQANGACAPIDAACDGLTPGDRYCDDKTVRECGPDQVNSEAIEECSAACRMVEGQAQCVTVKQVAAGSHTCAVLSTGQLRCWGANTAGQLGYGHTRNIGDEPYEMPPDDLALGEKVKHVAVGVIAAGGSHTCAVLESGSVRCWGQNQAGQLGLEHTETIGDDELPTEDVPLGEPATQVALGQWHSCALLASGAVECWGNTLLEADTTSDPAEFYSENIPLGSKAIQVVSHAGHACALLETGAVRCWGANFWGETGMAPDPYEPLAGLSPEIALGGSATHLGLGREMSCAVVGDPGLARCWGDGRGFRLGTGDDEPVGEEAEDMPPFAVALGTIGSSAYQVGASGSHACALMHSGVVKCWGSGSSSGYGVSDVIDTFPPPNVNLDGQASALSVGDSSSTCVILVDGNLQCWGSNSMGSLGLGHTDFVGDDETPADAGLVPVF